MRRLPVYLLLDVSTSMTGEPIAAVNNGIDTLLSSLRQDPHALETAFLSVIEFGMDAKQTVELTELMDFEAPELIANGLTSMGASLDLLGDRVNAEVKTSSSGQRGDWKPLVFLFTDGLATDDFQSAVNRLDRSKLGTIIACAAGPYADTSELVSLTENIVRLDSLDTTSISAFFKWVSASVSMSSVKVDAGNETSGLNDLPPPPPEVRLV